MELSSLLVGLSLGAAAALAVWFWQRGQGAALRARAEDSQAAKAALEERLGVLTEESRDLARREAALSAELAGERRRVTEQQDILRKFEQDLPSKFAGLAREELERNNNRFTDLAGLRLNPITEHLAKFDAAVQALESKREGAYQALKGQLESVARHNDALRSETAKLGEALRSAKIGGRWAEIQLRNVVEWAGLRKHCDFAEQASFTVNGQVFRPDMMIRLSGGLLLPVDAKAPLTNYLDAMQTEDEDKRSQSLKKYAQAVRGHANDLIKRDYKGLLPQTPGFVVLFLPNEALLNAVLDGDQHLLRESAENKVILATPMTLIAILQSVDFAWRQEAMTENAHKIKQEGEELYKRLGHFVDLLGKLGKNLESSVGAYNKVVGSFEARLLPKAREFESLGVAASAKMIEAPTPVDGQARTLKADGSPGLASGDIAH